jgi:hypothetical protein
MSIKHDCAQTEKEARWGWGLLGLSFGFNVYALYDEFVLPAIVLCLLGLLIIFFGPKNETV